MEAPIMTPTMNTSQEEQEKAKAIYYDPSRLNKTGRRRVDEGMLCFVYPESKTEFAAVCVDLGLTARGRTIGEAKAELHQVIGDVLELAAEQRMLEDVLNRPDNRAAKRELRGMMIVYGVARCIFAAMRLFRSMVPESPIDEYREQQTLCPA